MNVTDKELEDYGDYLKGEIGKPQPKEHSDALVDTVDRVEKEIASRKRKKRNDKIDNVFSDQLLAVQLQMRWELIAMMGTPDEIKAIKFEKRNYKIEKLLTDARNEGTTANLQRVPETKRGRRDSNDKTT